MFGLVVMSSLLWVWELEALSLNLATGSVWEITSYSRLMLTSVFDGAKWTAIAHSNLLLPQARAQQVECHYSHTQVENVNSGRPHLPIFHLAKKRKKKWTIRSLHMVSYIPSKLITNLTSWSKFSQFGELKMRGKTPLQTPLRDTNLFKKFQIRFIKPYPS